MLIIETPIFTRRVQKAMSEEEYHRLQVALLEDPELGTDLGGGLYKVRWGIKGGGKSGGARVLYYWVRPDQILMLFLFEKNERSNLTADQEKELRKVARTEFRRRK